MTERGDQQRLRLFIAIDLPPPVKALVGEILGMMAAQVGDAVRWVDAAGTHITLKYLGETTKLAEIKQELDGVGPQASPFDCEITQPGVFPHPRQPRIVWLGVQGDLNTLGRLQQLVEAKISPLGFPAEQRSFKPHITLGRARGQLQPQAVAELRQFIDHSVALPPPQRWTVQDLVVMLSETGPRGARYTPLHTVPLGGVNLV